MIDRILGYAIFGFAVLGAFCGGTTLRSVICNAQGGSAIIRHYPGDLGIFGEFECRTVKELAERAARIDGYFQRPAETSQ